MSIDQTKQRSAFDAANELWDGNLPDLTVGEVLDQMEKNLSDVMINDWDALVAAIQASGAQVPALALEFQSGDFSSITDPMGIISAAIGLLPLDMPFLEALQQANGNVSEFEDFGADIVPSDFKWESSLDDPSIVSPLYELLPDGSWFSELVQDTDLSDGIDWGTGTDRDSLFNTLVNQVKDEIGGMISSYGESLGVPGAGLVKAVNNVKVVKDSLLNGAKNLIDGLERTLRDGPAAGDSYIRDAFKGFGDAARELVDDGFGFKAYDFLGISVREVNSFEVAIHAPGATINGTDKKDVIYTGSLGVEVHAGDGDDIIISQLGNDYVDGGLGMDTLNIYTNFSGYMFTVNATRSVVSLNYFGDDPDKQNFREFSIEKFIFLDREIDLSNVSSVFGNFGLLESMAAPIELGYVVKGASGAGYDSTLIPISYNFDAGVTYQLNLKNESSHPIKFTSANLVGYFNGEEVYNNGDSGASKTFTPTESGKYVFQLSSSGSSVNYFEFSVAEYVPSVWKSDAKNIEIAASTYQFFTHVIPGQGGFEFLIDSNENTNDLNDPYYEQYNTENKYINFANNLGSLGEGKLEFTEKYGDLSFYETVKTAFEEIIGSQAIIDDGGDIEHALDFYIGSYDYYAQVAMERVVPSGVELSHAIKVVAIGSILNEAMKANLGRYSDAIDGVINEISTSGQTNLFEQDLFA